ncbi:MAG: translation initiation factor IF-6 [Promethearchaeota archaeon]|nr:MAG: translation initiation factor IF-6 [Candidatus Lokiarchaeota archaeon]
MAIIKTEIFGRSLIGAFLEANNSFVLYPSTLNKSDLKRMKNIFNVPHFSFTINNSKLLGIYSASNTNGLILPNIIRDDELESLKKNLKDLGNSVQIEALKSRDNAFGNLILCNDKGAIISSLLRSFKDRIEDILGVEAVIYDFAGVYLPGSIGLANNNGCLVHPLATDEDIEYISSVLKVETDVSTINRGTPYLSAGAAVNDNFGVFGSQTTGPEMMRLTNVLRL